MGLALELALFKSQCAYRGVGAQRIQASTNQFPVPYTLPNPDLVATLPRLRRFARVLTGDVKRADDLVQDTLARAWEKRRSWHAGTDLRAWLFRIMHNAHANQSSLPQRRPSEISPGGDEGTTGGGESAVRASQSN